MSGHSPSPAAGNGLQVVYIVVGVAAAVVVVVSVLCVVRRKGWSPFNKGETEQIGSTNLNIRHNNENLELQNNSDHNRVTDNGIYVGDSSSDGDSTEWSTDDDDEVTDHVNAPRIYNTPNYYGNVDHQCDVFHVQGQNVHPGEWTERETSGYVAEF
ncbi:uncharacterized protein [Haliotis cracherodii]|uniref:uncharacterized protein n=1 Tax=Haliotis cracherodii TaxID=6455 RepID=UPI0039E91E9E